MRDAFDYDEAVRQKRRNHILLLLVLFLSVFTPQEVERVCGVSREGPTQAFNCVHALFPSRELEYVALTRPWSRAALHPAVRGGALEEVAYETCLTTAPSFSVPVSDVPTLPNPPVSAALPRPEVVERRREIRGPPLPPIALLTPSPRAPPIA
jgi:hypothetical protein